MAKKIYNYCSQFPIVHSISGNRDTLRRFVRVKAMEFCFDNTEDLNSCLSEVTINEVIDMLRN